MEIHHRNPAAAQNLLHRNLVHTVGRSESVAAYIRDAQHGKHSLKGAVLAIGSVKSRKNGINLRHNLLSAEKPRIAVEIEIPIDRFEIDLCAAPQQRRHVAICLQLKKSRSGVPFAGLGDVDRHYLIFLLVHRLHYLRSGNNGNLIFD